MIHRGTIHLSCKQSLCLKKENSKYFNPINTTAAIAERESYMHTNNCEDTKHCYSCSQQGEKQLQQEPGCKE